MTQPHTSGSSRREDARNLGQPTDATGRVDNTLNAALGCAATVALVVGVVLIVYLWTL
jgi:hypothetical protein